MARPSRGLISALRVTAERLLSDPAYRWTHMGGCNCGQLAQTVTRLSRAEIHALALEKAGDWSDQVREYCPSSGLAMDLIIAEMVVLGLEPGDLARLEWLSDREIRARIVDRFPNIDHRNRDHVAAYLEAWAELLEQRLARTASFDLARVER